MRLSSARISMQISAWVPVFVTIGEKNKTLPILRSPLICPSSCDEELFISVLRCHPL
jgi:hypothetical protein